MKDYNKWEVWLADVMFEDEPVSKLRPVIILNADEVFVLGIKVTSHKPRNCWGDYAILEWEYAGLNRPSTARIAKKVKLVDNDIVQWIGKLHPLDIMNIQSILMQERQDVCHEYVI